MRRAGENTLPLAGMERQIGKKHISIAACIAMFVTGVGFEPTPFRTSALSWRLRPLGQPISTYGN